MTNDATKCVLQGEDGVRKEIEFPMYLMRIDDKCWFLPIRKAGVAYDSNYCKVEIVGLVLAAPDFSVRTITREERSKISEIADENSANK